MEHGQTNLPEPFPREPIPPEILEWARQHTTEAEFWESVREMERSGGGLELKDVLDELLKKPKNG